VLLGGVETEIDGACVRRIECLLDDRSGDAGRLAAHEPRRHLVLADRRLGESLGEGEEVGINLDRAALGEAVCVDAGHPQCVEVVEADLERGLRIRVGGHGDQHAAGDGGIARAVREGDAQAQAPGGSGLCRGTGRGVGGRRRGDGGRSGWTGCASARKQHGSERRDDDERGPHDDSASSALDHAIPELAAVSRARSAAASPENAAAHAAADGETDPRDRRNTGDPA
jgi:hypothetical protein